VTCYRVLITVNPLYIRSYAASCATALPLVDVELMKASAFGWVVCVFFDMLQG